MPMTRQDSRPPRPLESTPSMPPLTFATRPCIGCRAEAAEGARVVAPPADQPWGERLASVADPDGYVVHVGAAG